MTKIIYTYTDEAPALATDSLLPIVEAFLAKAEIEIETRDISLAARILARFPERLTAQQQVPDALAELGALTANPTANIIKLPNVSASLPQLKAAIAELQTQGYELPDYPDAPATDEEREVRARYDTVKGSAVNPVLREGNSDRRAPAAVKAYARAHPHAMGAWSPDSATSVATMDAGDFRDTELSVTMPTADRLKIAFIGTDGTEAVLKDAFPVEQGEIIDGAVMRYKQLAQFLEQQITAAKRDGVLFSLHMKATMMKVSDPVIFGYAVNAYFAEAFATGAQMLVKAGADPADGLGGVLTALETLPDAEARPVRAAISAALESGPPLAMVDSARGITNLHVPSDIIIDASMPAMIRDGGKMWNAAGDRQDALCVIPDSSYAALYAETIDFCRRHGAFDPATMGTTPNVGLMAQKAEEYGSHDKTFKIASDGVVRVTNSAGEVLIEHQVAEGDIWRGCQTKDTPVRSWVGLAVERARATGVPTVFWLDSSRAHDAQLLIKVGEELKRLQTDGLTIEIMPVAEATRYTLQRAADGQDTISVTGNVLRDYLTDLFPILELGTSAKMLSIVPLMGGGGLYETGAGGSAPKHVQQLLAENHLRWDSLGEFLALAVSLEDLASKTGNSKAQLLARTLDAATGELLDGGFSPSRKVGENDSRGSHFQLARLWALQLAHQNEDAEIASAFTPLAAALEAGRRKIERELIDCQGKSVDLGGYYCVDRELAAAVMRPSEALNLALAER